MIPQYAQSLQLRHAVHREDQGVVAILDQKIMGKVEVVKPVINVGPTLDS